MELTLQNSINIILQQNAQILNQELEWLREVIHVRLALHFEQETSYQSIDQLPVPYVLDAEGSYADFVREHRLSVEERLVLILALIPHLKPGLLDVMLTKNHDYDRRYSEFGGVLLDGHLGLVPTAETAMFILAGEDLEKRLYYQHIFNSQHPFF
ncbi:hypothetical protein LVD15_15325 [Fulvivirga maritima]|uniref:hypothetical protein n=1 Tax=Fulvivirga maritima TaxID=2904247 RepID=UPI001F249B21|nr:hypothetical protein [Fulvivirga maritima]UII24685.1 hypothetical protein LVD15_15325 [Fulvivirga maritima]